MSIINTHDVTLYGSTGEHDIILRPLCDEHLPFLYKWSADPELLYWTESGVEADIEQGYDAETVHAIYGSVSQNALCFLIEVDEVPVGECWLQKMNIDNVKAMYPENADVRRIDMSIGEKTMWGKGIGTAFIDMLVDYAFNGEYVEILHCICDDYNIRSRRVFEKNGFTHALSEDLPQPQKGKQQHHFRLIRQEYVESRRVKMPPDKIFDLPITELRPSQLYISEGKLRLVRDWFDPADKTNFDPIPVKLYNGRHLMTDGHTRAVVAALSGWETVPATWDDDPLDMLAYAHCVKWCDDEGIKNAADLSKRIVSHKDYLELWHKRCHYMEIQPSYAAIVARFGGVDGRHKVVILTDEDKLKTARLIQSECTAFVKEIIVINLDETSDYKIIYTLLPTDLLILSIGIESFIGRHNKMACAFNKPEGVASKYICIRPTITAQALFDGLNTPDGVTKKIIKGYADLSLGNTIRIAAKSGTDISFKWLFPSLRNPENPWLFRDEQYSRMCEVNN